MDFHELNDQLPQVSPNIETVGQITLKEGVNVELLFDSHHGVSNFRHVFNLAKHYGFSGPWVEGYDIENCEEAEQYLNNEVCVGCSIQWSDDVWVVRDGYDIENGEQDDETNEKIETVRIPVWALPYLINGETGTLTDEELEQCKKLEKKYSTISAPDANGEPFFSHRNDLDNLGGDCYDCLCIRRETSGETEPFTVHATFCTSNFGGIELELSPCGERVRYRHHYGQETQDAPKEAEIVYRQDKDLDGTSADDGHGDYPCFIDGEGENETVYFLADFMRV